MKWPFTKKQETILLVPLSAISLIVGLLFLNTSTSLLGLLLFAIFYVRWIELYFNDVVSYFEKRKKISK